MAESGDDPPAWIEELRRQRASRRASGTEPRGRPISSSFTLPSSVLDRDRRLRKMLDIIDRLHGNGHLPVVRVTWRTLQDRRAAEFLAFAAEAELPDQLRIDPSRRRWAIAAIHEVGHLLDLRGLGTPLHPASVDDDRMDPWRRAVETSGEVAMLGNLLGGPDEYYLRPEELWARSYAQWVAERSALPWLRRQIRELRGTNRRQVTYYTQWDDDAFAPIAAATDDLFRGLGWIA